MYFDDALHACNSCHLLDLARNTIWLTQRASSATGRFPSIRQKSFSGPRGSMGSVVDSHLVDRFDKTVGRQRRNTPSPLLHFFNAPVSFGISVLLEVGSIHIVLFFLRLTFRSIENARDGCARAYLICVASKQRYRALKSCPSFDWYTAGSDTYRGYFLFKDDEQSLEAVAIMNHVQLTSNGKNRTLKLDFSNQNPATIAGLTGEISY